MALKRKRSSATLSSPSTNSDTSAMDTSSIPSFYAQHKPVESIPQKSNWLCSTDGDVLSAQHLNSRTRKRHRDDRPDDQQVFGVSCWLGAVIQMSTLADVCRCAASTIQRLYDAQRQLPGASPVPSATPNLPAPTQRSTLHSFWHINQGLPRSAAPMQLDAAKTSIASFEMKCEDCDRPLQREDAMDVDDGILEQETACFVCERHVCDTCAVLGNERICLGCASGR